MTSQEHEKTIRNIATEALKASDLNGDLRPVCQGIAAGKISGHEMSILLLADKKFTENPDISAGENLLNRIKVWLKAVGSRDRNRKFTLVRAEELKVSKPEFLIDGLLEADMLAQIFGDPGSCKSFLAIDWACCIATGTDFHGHKVRQGLVVYIAGEGQGGIARRLKA